MDTNTGHAVAPTAARIMHLNNLIEAQEYLNVEITPPAAQFITYVASNTRGVVIASLTELSAILAIPKRTLQRHIDAAVASGFVVETQADAVNMKKSYRLTLPNVVVFGGFTHHQAQYYCQSTGLTDLYEAYQAKAATSDILHGALCVVDIAASSIVRVVPKYRQLAKNRGCLRTSNRSQNRTEGSQKGKEGSQICKRGSQICTRYSQIDHPLIDHNKTAIDLFNKKTNQGSQVHPDSASDYAPESLKNLKELDQGLENLPVSENFKVEFDKTEKHAQTTATTTPKEGDPVTVKQYDKATQVTYRKTSVAEVLDTIQQGGDVRSLHTQTNKPNKRTAARGNGIPTLPTGNNQAQLKPNHLNGVLRRIERITNAANPDAPYAYGHVSANQYKALAARFAGDDEKPDYVTAAKAIAFTLSSWSKWCIHINSTKPKSMIGVMWKQNTDALIDFVVKYQSTFHKYDFETLYYTNEKQRDQVATLKEGANPPKNAVGAPPSRNKATGAPTQQNANEDDVDAFLASVSKSL